ncbi:MAG: hypothetical protein MUO54_13670 [Anaerolineales bacterium]|nr:hypothetical protein [Anaerolineales bacterium]
MKKHWYHLGWLLLAGIVLLLAGCRSGVEAEDPYLLETPSGTEEARNEFDNESRFPETGVIYQWAISAEASSEFSDPEWSADQSVGEPDSPGCGDY